MGWQREMMSGGVVLPVDDFLLMLEVDLLQ